VHDSILIDCYKPETERIKKIITAVVDNLPQFFDWMSIKMEIDIVTGESML
jgi:DNA polymerase I-like protein with 3'-5' exonuclease and polymerase domains